MSYWAGLLEGISGGVERRSNQRREDQLIADQRELDVLKALAVSPNLDDDVRTQAVAGMLELGMPRKRKKGLGGFFGEVEQSPYLPMIQGALRRNVLPQVGGVPRGTQPPPQAQPGSATLPQGSPVEPDGPPMRLLAGQQPFAPIPADTEGPAYEDAPYEPPEQAVFRSETSAPATPPQRPAGSVPPPQRRQFGAPLASPDEQRFHNTTADVDAEAEGVYRQALNMGASEEEARQYAMQAVAGRGNQSLIPRLQAKEYEDYQGTRTIATFNPITGTYTDLEGRVRTDLRPITTARTNPNSMVYQIANELFGVEPHNLSAEQSAVVNMTLRDRQIALAGGTTGARVQATNRALLDRALTPEQAAIQGVPIGTTPSNVMGQVPRTAQGQQMSAGAQMVLAQLPSVEALVTQVFPDQNGFIGSYAASWNNWLLDKQKDPNFGVLKAKMLDLKSAIARARDVGNLSQYEQEAAQETIGAVEGALLRGGETRESLLAKLGALRDRMGLIQQQYPGLGQPPPQRQPLNPDAAQLQDRGPFVWKGKTYQWGQPIQYAGVPMYVVGVGARGLKLTDQPPQ